LRGIGTQGSNPGLESAVGIFVDGVYRARNGEDYWCQGYSEPGSGSDLASLQTRAARDGDAYVVNGMKIWTSFAHESDWMFALVRTDNSGKHQEGISVLLIDMHAKGVSHRPIITIDGVRADYTDGFGLIRGSNTTPVLVLRFEGHTQAALQRIERDFMAALRAVKPDAQIETAAH